MVSSSNRTLCRAIAPELTIQAGNCHALCKDAFRPSRIRLAVMRVTLDAYIHVRAACGCLFDGRYETIAEDLVVNFLWKTGS